MNRAFALVELLIVVLVLGILAGVVVPYVGSPLADTEEAALAANLQSLRAAVSLFEAQHPAVEAVYPGQLTIATDRAGRPGGPYGPYLRRGYPANPINGLDTVLTVAAMPDEPDGSTGWLYDASTGAFRANVAGIGEGGLPYFRF